MANFEARRKLSELIEKCTKVKDTSTNSISDDALKKLKEILKDNNENVKSFFDLLMIQLQAKNSHTRYLTVLLIDYIFTRSKYFRELLVKDMKPFFDLAVGTENDKPLPSEPTGWANSLREKSLDAIEKWNTSFGQLYKQLRNGYNYLKCTRKMKFPDLQAAARRREEQERSRQERTQRILQLKFDKLEKELEEKIPEIEQNLQLMDNSFKILVPNLGFGVTATATESEETTHDANETFDEIVQNHGLGSTSYEITISVDKTPTILKEENDALINTLQDCYKVLNNQMRQVKDWSKVLVKLRSAEQANKELQETLLKRVIDLQNEMKAAQEKCEELKILEYDLNKSLNRSSFGQDQDDDAEVEFEDGAVYEDNEGNQMVLVPRKEGYEEFHPDEQFEDDFNTSITTTSTTATLEIDEGHQTLTDALSRDYYYTTPTKPQAKSKLSNNNNNNNNNNLSNSNSNSNSNNSNSTDNNETKPPSDDTYQPHWLRKSAGDSNEELKEDETKTDMLKRAPVMKNEPFLYFWGKSEIDLNTGLECNHRFLGSSKADTVVSTDRLGSDMYMRTVYYEPKAVDHPPCRAPKKDGTLCTRRDAKFCPFHGPVIPRDEKGNPIDEPDIQEQTTKPLNTSTDQAPSSELIGSDADIQLPLFGTGTEVGQQVERKKRKSEIGLRDRIKEKSTPKKQSRVSL